MFRSLGGGDLSTNRTKTVHPHPMTELCAEGSRLYANALRTGRIPRAEAEAAPCLVDFSLLHPDPDDPGPSGWKRAPLTDRPIPGNYE